MDKHLKVDKGKPQLNKGKAPDDRKVCKGEKHRFNCKEGSVTYECHHKECTAKCSSGKEVSHEAFAFFAFLDKD